MILRREKETYLTDISLLSSTSRTLSCPTSAAAPISSSSSGSGSTEQQSALLGQNSSTLLPFANNNDGQHILLFQILRLGLQNMLKNMQDIGKTA